MKIEHVAFWVADLETMRSFYETYFNAKTNTKYHNLVKKFSSYFLTFEGGCRLELMHREGITNASTKHDLVATGITHLAFSVGSKANVDELTTKLKNDGYIVTGEPRTTGDNYYESVILDPENNIIEITE